MSVRATDIVQKDRFVGRGELDLVLARTVLGTLPGQALVIANTSSPVLRVDAPVGKVSFKRDREIVVLEVGSHFFFVELGVGSLRSRAFIPFPMLRVSRGLLSFSLGEGTHGVSRIFEISEIFMKILRDLKDLCSLTA